VTLTFLVQHPRNDEDAPYRVCVTLPDIDPHNISGIQKAMDYWKNAFERYFPGSQVQHETYEHLAHSFGGLTTDEFMQEREATLREREIRAGDKVTTIDSGK
jgi:hypothetical protein